MRRRGHSTPVIPVVALAAFVTLTMLLGGPQPPAAAVPAQVSAATAGTSASSAPLPTVTRPVSTTSPATTPTTPAVSPTTAAPAPTTAPTAPTTAPPRPPVTAATPYVAPTHRQATTTVATTPTTSTTIAGIEGRLPASPLTVPLQTASSSGHVDPVFAWLSGIGFAIALLIVGARLYVTRSGGQDRAPVS